MKPPCRSGRNGEPAAGLSERKSGEDVWGQSAASRAVRGGDVDDFPVYLLYMKNFNLKVTKVIKLILVKYLFL